MKQGWTYKKFSEVFNLQMGKTPSRDNLSYWGGENIWVSIADMKGKFIDSTKEHITDIAVSESGIHKVPQGTAIMSFKLTIGRAAITKCDLYTNEAIMSFEPKEAGSLLSDYVFYYLKGCKWTGANKAVMGQTLNKKTISENTFAYPSIETQQLIVSELDLLQSIIDKQQAQLKELDNLAQSIFYEMFGDPVENEKQWSVKKLGEICNSELGKMLDAKKNTGTYRDYLCTINVLWGDFDFTTVKQMKIEEKDIERYSVRKGDLLICEGGDTGRCAIWKKDSPICYQNSLHRVRLFPNTLLPITCQFIFLIMKKHGELDKYSKGQTIKHLVKNVLLSIPVPIPPIALQQSFAAKIESIEKQKAAITKSIEETQKLFDFTMDKYFG